MFNLAVSASQLVVSPLQKWPLMAFILVGALACRFDHVCRGRRGMARCPRCVSKISPDADQCAGCGVDFGDPMSRRVNRHERRDPRLLARHFKGSAASVSHDHRRRGAHRRDNRFAPPRPAVATGDRWPDSHHDHGRGSMECGGRVMGSAKAGGLAQYRGCSGAPFTKQRGVGGSLRIATREIRSESTSAKDRGILVQFQPVKSGWLISYPIRTR